MSKTAFGPSMHIQATSNIFILHLTIMVMFLNGYISSDYINGEKCGRIEVPMSRIIGGDYARPGEFPWMVSLHERTVKNGNNFRHLCGGTIINERWIITAAHCFFRAKRPLDYMVYAGLHKLTELNLKRVQRLKVSKFIIHESYDSLTFENDIALIRTKKPIDFRGSWGYANAICLPTDEKDPEGWVTVTGWGHMLEGGYKSNVLQRVKVPIVPRDICNETYASLSNGTKIIEIEGGHKYYYGRPYMGMQNTKICAGLMNKDSCQSDSGGPLIQINETGVATLIGVVSYGEGCGKDGYPGVYTKVASYVKWIRQEISSS